MDPQTQLLVDLPSLLNWELNPYQSVVDLVLILFAAYVLLQKPDKPEKPFTKEEVDSLIAEWEPEALFPPLTPIQQLDSRVPTIQGTNVTHVTIDNRPVLNLARFNFLGFVANPQIEEAARKTVYQYGVGTCGPRQFYGTIDVHIELEKRIAQFMKTEECMIYSYGVATSSSSIPAFAGRGDLLVVDKGISISLQLGVNLSRSEVLWYEHNNMEDLERVLKSVQKKDQQTKRKVTRRFIVFEGVSFNYGDIAPLPKIVELKNKYKFRTIMEDLGIGSIGKSGRGTCDYHNVDVKEINILTGNLEYIAGSVGGFCCGRKDIIFHQRLNSTGYVYSASLPPLLAAHSQTALNIIDQQPQLLATHRRNVEFFYKGLSSINGLVIKSNPQAPLIHVELAQAFDNRYDAERILQVIVDESLAGGVLLTRAKYSRDEKFMPRPSIRICVTAANSLDQLANALNVIKTATAVAMSGISGASSSGTPSSTLFRRSLSTQNF